MLIEAKRIKQEETSNKTNRNKQQYYLIGSNNSLLCGCSIYVHAAWR